MKKTYMKPQMAAEYIGTLDVITLSKQDTEFYDDSNVIGYDEFLN